MFEEFKSSRNEPLSNSYVYMNIGEVENYCNNLDDFPLGLLPNGFWYTTQRWRKLGPPTR
jgi:hypothetical protein